MAALGEIHYSKALKEEIVALLEQGYKANFLARHYNLPVSTIKHFPIQVNRKNKEKEDLQAAIDKLKGVSGLEVRTASSRTTQVVTNPKGPRDAGFSTRLDQDRPEVPKNKTQPTSVVLAIPDLHCPFEHPDALEFLKAVRDTYQPTKIVCLGDEVDFHAMSRFPHDPDGYSPGHELSEAVKHLLPFYLEFPEVMVCKSNHTVRGHKKAFEAGLPGAFLAHISKVLNAPDGWEWKQRHEIDDVMYIHGEGKSGFNAHIQFMRAYRRKVVHGHIHSYAAVSHEGDLFAVNSGCLIDKTAYCNRYADHMPIEVSLGCSVIHHGKRAEFIPMITENGRWVGHL